MTRSTVAGAAATVAAAAIALAFIYKSRRRAFSSTDPLKVHVLRDLPPETRALLSKLLRSNVQISTGPQPPPPGGAHVLVAGFGKGGDAVLTMESAVGPATKARANARRRRRTSRRSGSRRLYASRRSVADPRTDPLA